MMILTTRDVIVNLPSNVDRTTVSEQLESTIIEPCYIYSEIISSLRLEKYV